MVSTLRTAARLLLLVFFVLCLPTPARGQSATPPDNPSAAPAQNLNTRTPEYLNTKNPNAQRPAPNAYRPNIPPQAIAYQRAQRVLALGSLVWSLAGLWLLLRSGLAARLRDRTYQILRRPLPPPDAVPPFRAVLLYYALFAFLFLLWRLPAGFPRLALEHHYGFSRQSPLGHLGDVLTGYAFSFALVPLFWGGAWLIARSPRRWWLWLWAALIPLLFAQIVLTPVLIYPAYNRYTPMEAGPLRDRIIELAAKAGITDSRVLVEDTSRRTSKVNAYVAGLGPTTRIVLNDTALHTLPEDELLAMMGHEMGHYVEGHIWVLYGGSVVGAGAFLWLAAWLLPWIVQKRGRVWRLRGLLDLAALPLVMLFLSLCALAQQPIASAESRFLERRADAYGLRLTGLHEATARLMVGFAERDYADPDPPTLLHFWFGTHPTLSERIAFALERKP